MLSSERSRKWCGNIGIMVESWPLPVTSQFTSQCVQLWPLSTSLSHFHTFGPSTRAKQLNRTNRIDSHDSHTHILHLTLGNQSSTTPPSRPGKLALKSLALVPGTPAASELRPTKHAPEATDRREKPRMNQNESNVHLFTYLLTCSIHAVCFSFNQRPRHK